MPKKCKMCKKLVKGRTDKVFCSPSCKSTYHNKLKRVTRDVTTEIDKILHRNRSILLEIMGKREIKKIVPKHLLDEKRFNYSYITGTHVNVQGKRVSQVYDFSYLIFTNQDVLITRSKKLSKLF